MGRAAFLVITMEKGYCMERTKYIYRVLAILLLVCSLGIAGCFGPTTVKVEKAAVREMPLQITRDANVTALTKATIVPTVSGTVASFKVKVGDMVKAGQVVATLDGASLEAQLQSLQGELAHAGSGASSYQVNSGSVVQSNDNGRARELLNAGIITQKEYEALVAKNGTSLVVVNRSGAVATGGGSSDAGAIRAAIAQVQAQLAQLDITAPIDGQVSAIYNEDRKVAVAERPFMMIQQASPLVGTLSVPRVFAAKLGALDKKSIQVFLTVKGVQVPGELTYVEPIAGDTSPAAMIRATFDNTKGLLSAGEFYPLTIISTAKAMVTAIPEKAVHNNKDSKFVYIVTPDSTVDVRLVEVGDTQDGYVTIVSGLSEGEQVIVSKGSYELGEKVKLES